MLEGETHHEEPRPDPHGSIKGPVGDALAMLPDGVFIITARFEDDRSGVRVLSAMPCATEPVLVAVAARKGHSIEPLIRDSHHFALCVVSPSDRLLIQKFPMGSEPRGGDPFDAVSTLSLGTGSPVPARCPAAFDCEVVRHFDLDADHEIYVGQVLAVRVSNEA